MNAENYFHAVEKTRVDSSHFPPRLRPGLGKQPPRLHGSRVLRAVQQWCKNASSKCRSLLRSAPCERAFLEVTPVWPIRGIWQSWMNHISVMLDGARGFLGLPRLRADGGRLQWTVIIMLSDVRGIPAKRWLLDWDDAGRSEKLET